MAILRTPQPVTTVDWSNFSSTVVEVNGHVESRYNAENDEWSTPEYVHGHNVPNQGLEPVLAYGDQEYERIKACRNPHGDILIFRPDFHADRVQHLSCIMSIPSMSHDHFTRCIELAVARNAEYVPPHGSTSMLYIKPTIFGPVAPRSGSSSSSRGSSNFLLSVAVSPGRDCHIKRPTDAVVMDDLNGATPDSSSSTKGSGQTREKEYGLTLHVDARTHTEIVGFSGASFIGVLGGGGDQIRILLPENCNFLESSTNDSCTTLARSLGWAVEKRGIHVASLSEFSEVFAVGTTADLTPVKSITHLHDNSRVQVTYDATDEGKAGPVAMELCQRLKAIQMGKTPDELGWCYKVRLL
ncbi:branched-chain-amino-acid aminotransferase 1 [Aspergillus steynii IBT 23096]|uniref:Branched-chain-amino-acid aminotransferase 1 n=1 Tax=Aspergillus steynii IBT 23096 TaxID=1392250 RepID=A0A2I2GEQ3_9EURO|nr:branched-chain-amino-acid aminotransferase 1 [Aspergillus steynii IBT 23096]PLB51342.1 branched-chain-amino-acid aminotransferase 1 [Aspergillus steynii IBT 23096]